MRGVKSRTALGDIYEERLRSLSHGSAIGFVNGLTLHLRLILCGREFPIQILGGVLLFCKAFDEGGNG